MQHPSHRSGPSDATATYPMPEPIREAKIAEPASPLGYRSGIADYNELSPLRQMDGPLVRFALLMLGFPIGILVGFAILVVLGTLSHPSRDLRIFVAIIHLFLLAMECVLLKKLAAFAPTRTAAVIRGLLWGMILIPIGLIICAVNIWIYGVW